MWGPGSTTIDRLRVKAEPERADQAAALRLRLSHLLGTAELIPPGFPPSAILIVRRLADPLPGRLAGDERAMRADPDWDRAVQAALAGLWHTAARPAAGPVPAGAEAVCFDDLAQLLACLALALGRGEAGGQWWWQSVLRTYRRAGGGGGEPSAAEALAAQPHLLPAVLNHLMKQGAAIEVLRAMTPAEAEELALQMGSEFSLTDWTSPVAPRTDESSIESLQHSPTEPVETRRAPRLQLHREPPPPWEGLLPPGRVPHGLSAPARALLGLGLVLARRPAAARTGRFARSLRVWWAAASAQGPDRPPERPHLAGAQERERPGTAPPALAPEYPVESGQPMGELPGRVPATPEAGGETRRPHRQEARSAERRRATEERYQPQPARQEVQPPWQEAAAGHLAPVPDPTSVAERASPEKEAEAAEVGGVDPEEPPAHRMQEGVDSHLCGLFYLVNLMLALDLPASFEEDWSLDSRAGPWAVLEALGRGLLGEEWPAHAGDPVWAALALLDGRPEGSLAGEGLPGCERFRLPAAWLTTQGLGGPWRWNLAEGHLRIWSEQGYTLADLPAESDPATQATTLLAGCGSPDQPLRSHEEPPRAVAPGLSRVSPSLERWASLALPAVQLLAARALGESLAPALLMVPGRLYVTSSHLDILMPLDRISLPVRMAGLDRNPGWQPAWGRVISFHFS